MLIAKKSASLFKTAILSWGARLVFVGLALGWSTAWSDELGRDHPVVKLVQDYCSQGFFSGTVQVGWGDQFSWDYACGPANIPFDIPNQPNNRFLVGSNTKGFTATLIMQLVGEGEVSLDGTISDYLPYYTSPVGSQVKIRHLLEMSSGIPSYTSVQSSEEFYETYLHPWSVQEFVEEFCMPESLEDLEFTPGTEYEYSNSNYYILGAIIELVTNQDYPQTLQNKILAPANMSNTGAYEFTTIIDRLASGYSIPTAGATDFNSMRFHFSVADQLLATAPGFSPRVTEPTDISGMMFIQPQSAYAAGYLYSTLQDFKKWNNIIHYSNTLLPEGLREEMLSPHKQSAPAEIVCQYYGYGWFIQYMDPTSSDPPPPANCPEDPASIPANLIKAFNYTGVYPDGFNANFISVPELNRLRIVALTNYYYGDNSASYCLGQGILNIFLYGSPEFDSTWMLGCPSTS